MSEDSIMLQFSVHHHALTTEQEHHIEAVGKEFTTLMTGKYIYGQKQHGGNLWEKGTDFPLDNAIMEAIDQVVYLLTLRKALKR